MEYIKTVLIGLAIGIANVIPGFSGSTMAVVFNIYDKFVDAITLNVKKLIANRKFVIPLVLGMASGVLVFSKVITLLYSNFPAQTNNVFTGIVLGSIPMLFLYTVRPNPANNTANDTEQPQEKRKIPSISTCISIIAGLAVMLFFAYLQKVFNMETGVSGELPDLSVLLAIRIFLAGVLGAIAMIIPGISGSFIMLIMGIYPIVIAGVASIVVPAKFVHALIILLPNGIGVLLGLLCGAKLISTLIKRFYNQTYGVIFGLILGSLVVIFPGFSTWTTFGGVVISIICLAAGFAIAFFGSKQKQ